jgi:ATP-dependent HslUV protease ATP-binding subunit HslU
VPENAVTKQQKALLETERVNIEFTEDAIDEIASLAYLMNEETENIGARRLHTILETLLEDVSYNLPDPEIGDVKIDRAYVQDKLSEKFKEVDVDKYIL